MNRTGTGNAKPYVTLLPYLPLTEPITFACWWLGPLDRFEGPWLCDAFQAAVRRLANGFVTVDRQPLKRSAILVRQADGADGRPPTTEEHEALLLAIGFATIHRNAYWTPELQQGDGWKNATTDNALLWAQPIDLPEEWISFDRGSRVSTLVGGHRLTDKTFTIPPPLELHLPFAIRPDAAILNALYTLLLNPPPEYEQMVGRLKVAIRWLLKSWQNTPSITWEDRLVFLKVATEALTGEDRNDESAKQLVAIFESAQRQSGGGIGTEDLLWQPDERVLARTWTVRRTGRQRSSEVSQFEHWACALGDERNAIVHGEPTHNQVYTQGDSPYNGPFVEIADRVVREAILVQLGNAGYPEVWRSTFARAGLESMQHLREAAEETTS